MTKETTNICTLLSENQLKTLDSLILSGSYIQCLKFITDETGCHLKEAMYALPEREAKIGYVRSNRSDFPSFEELRDRCEELKPVAIQAVWNGDTQGWFVMLEAVIENVEVSDSYEIISLGTGRGASGDMRLFNRQVPPWPEAIEAKKLGEQLSIELGIPFHFNSPDKPDAPEDTPT